MWTATLKEIKTENETIVYEIEYSRDGKSFKRLYQVSALGSIEEIQKVAQDQINTLIANESVVEDILEYLDQPLTE